MQSHRSTQARVSKETEHSNFDAGTALENLRAEVVDIEALARAAEAAAEALPMPANDRQRVVFGRILSLATKTSNRRAPRSVSRMRRSPRSPRRRRRAGKVRSARPSRRFRGAMSLPGDLPEGSFPIDYQCTFPEGGGSLRRPAPLDMATLYQRWSAVVGTSK
jgi:hypothetical protein